jgi:hypothetical protein
VGGITAQRGVLRPGLGLVIALASSRNPARAGPVESPGLWPVLRKCQPLVGLRGCRPWVGMLWGRPLVGIALTLTFGQLRGRPRRDGPTIRTFWESGI